MTPANLPPKPPTGLPLGGTPVGKMANERSDIRAVPSQPLIRFPPPVYSSSHQIGTPLPITPPSYHHTTPSAQSDTSITSSSSTVWKTSKPIPVRPSKTLPARPSSLPSLPLSQTNVVFSLPPKPATATASATSTAMEGLIRFGPGVNVSSAILVHSEDESIDDAGDDIKLTSMKLVAKRKRVDSGHAPDHKHHKATIKQAGPRQKDHASAADRSKHPGAAQAPAQKGSSNMLSIPLPSRRFNKDNTRRATLFPVEQLPVFALPPLPEIKDEAALKQIFTHLSLFQKVKYKFEDPEDDLAKHYEKIEHVGDSILGMIVTTWLHEIKPGLTPGTATRLKAHLVSNATLSHLSGLYNLPNRLIADPNIAHVLRATTDVRAALMESYIAGFYYSHSVADRLSIALPALDTWLREMYEPLVDFFYTYMKNEHAQHLLAVGSDTEGHVIVMDQDEWDRVNGLATGMAQLIKAYTEGYERELRWEEDKYETSIGPLFKMTCVIDGMELGEGTRSEKRDAKNVAAWEAAKKLGLTVGVGMVRGGGIPSSS